MTLPFDMPTMRASMTDASEQGPRDSGGDRVEPREMTAADLAVTEHLDPTRYQTIRLVKIMTTDLGHLGLPLLP